MLRFVADMPTFDDILGQENAIETISRAYESERLPHGLIFAGPVGVGKATTAGALATLFLCEKPKGVEPCGKCASCTLMAAEPEPTHPDYHKVYRQLIRLEKETSKAKFLPVDVIRDHVNAPANLKSSMNVGKVFVIDEAELMNHQAQNALLRTLEEPSGRTLIILLTDQPHALLPTIRSRCQLVRFAPLDLHIVQRELEKRKIEKGIAGAAAALTEGSLGLALKWVQDGVVSAAGELIKQIDALLAGRAVGDLADWFKKAADAYAEQQLKRDKLASKDQATREGLSLYLKIAANRFRQRLASTTDPDDLEAACAAIDAIVRAENYLDSNVNVALTFQQLAATLERDFART
jgi:DNA polymerase-3 subunit delta'